MTVSILWCVGIAVGGGAVVFAAALALKETRLGERRHKWHDQTTAPAGAMFNALFLAAFALSLVISWQAYDHAKDDARKGDEAPFRFPTTCPSCGATVERSAEEVHGNSQFRPVPSKIAL